MRLLVKAAEVQPCTNCKMCYLLEDFEAVTAVLMTSFLGGCDAVKIGI